MEGSRRTAHVRTAGKELFQKRIWQLSKAYFDVNTDNSREPQTTVPHQRRGAAIRQLLTVLPTAR
jgi:hypothetical protein